MMKILNLLLICAACLVLLLVAYDADSPGTPKDPNPMKSNQEQFARTQPAFYAETSK
ncbi:hypothetical protein [Paenibacillus sp. SI8]|uniref:hypothetical protein n=1 Tax=unclassified Paenibacillus TaxID=185978 RepID=UPI0034651C15